MYAATKLPAIPVPPPAVSIGPAAIPVASADPFGMGLNKFMVTFPDGTRWSFKGFVSSQSVRSSIENVTELDVQIMPTGPSTFDQRPVITPKGDRARKARGTIMSVTNEQGEEDSFELMDITPPSTQVTQIEVTQNGMFGGKADDNEVFIPGLRRIGPISFTGVYNGKLL